ncbi:sulfurtransferase TusA family protein [Streptococcus loxodontisalivarius]|uniref:TusA-related sulfurtransferase n=1 Tax=Streptococcus loxodontisalivarius TaxID=1349415 RepID=A0ABS2PU24_9STRE|nr:sulfurtransferase TusA family protein [Streptococcus loxodontisalivarius]MBM7643547.1 TusA-related sulfurtransferase [Streptococcus loxodontisalivarius]
MVLVKLETGGQVCPFPLIDAKKKIAELNVGDELLIAFDCTQATESIPNWAAENHYPVTRFEQVGAASWEIVVQKK